MVAFEGAYHGLGFGALDATWRPLFRERFAARLPQATVFARFGELLSQLVACYAVRVQALHLVAGEQ